MAGGCFLYISAYCSFLAGTTVEKDSEHGTFHVSIVLAVLECWMHFCQGDVLMGLGVCEWQREQNLAFFSK